MASSAAGLGHYALLGSSCDVSGFKSCDFGLPLRCDAIIYQKARRARRFTAHRTQFRGARYESRRQVEIELALARYVTEVL